MMRSRAWLSVVIAAMVAAGCATVSSGPPGSVESGHAQIAVMPLRNDTNDVDGPSVVREAMARALLSRAYLVKSFGSTDTVLRDQFGVTLGGQLDNVSVQKLGEALDVDAILYGKLMDFKELTTGAYNERKVRATFRLVSTATGQVLWERGLGVRSEQVMQGGAGVGATVLGRMSDPRDAEAPWVTIEHIEAGRDYRESLAFGLGTRLLTQALGIHLAKESDALARLITENLHWWPESSGAPAERREP
jgi:hypothetical protein